MSTIEQACQCGCASMTQVTQAAEPCGCGCECCANTSKSRNDELTELRSLRDSVNARLAELEEA